MNKKPKLHAHPCSDSSEDTVFGIRLVSGDVIQAGDMYSDTIDKKWYPSTAVGKAITSSYEGKVNHFYVRPVKHD